MFSLVPTNAISIEIEEMGINRTSGLDLEHFTLRCCATKVVGGLSSDPTVAWYGLNGRISEGSFDAVVTEAEVHGEKTCVMLQFMPSGTREYSCEATLESTAMNEPLVETAIYRTGNEVSHNLKKNLYGVKRRMCKLIFFDASVFIVNRINSRLCDTFVVAWAKGT